MYFPLTNVDFGITTANKALSMNAILVHDVLLLRQQNF